MISAVVALDTTPVDAIQLVTGAAAKAIGLPNVTGALIPGLEADVLVVRGNAAENICCITRTEAVYISGHEVARDRRITSEVRGMHPGS